MKELPSSAWYPELLFSTPVDKKGSLSKEGDTGLASTLNTSRLEAAENCNCQRIKMTPERGLVMMYKVVNQHTKKLTDLLQAESNINTPATDAKFSDFGRIYPLVPDKNELIVNLRI